MKAIRFERVYHVPAPVERVWPVLADTERLNRRVGLPPTVFTLQPTGPVRSARVRARMAGIPLEWDEEPFEFVEHQFFWVRRRMLRGPIREFNGGMRFQSRGEGTEVRIESEFLPATALARPLIGALCAKTGRDCDAMIAGLRVHLCGEAPTPYGVGVDLCPPGVREATARRLRQADPELRREPLAERLFDHLAGAGDVELIAVRPFALARRWGADRYEVLRLCLQAARAGVLDLSWDLICPNCRGARNRWNSLEQVRDRSHCDDCQISFGANFDQLVEVTFRPNARYRLVEGEVYCSGGPRNTPHVVAQKTLDPGEGETVEPWLAEGRYRVRNLTADLSVELFVSDRGSVTQAQACFEEGGARLEPAEAPVAAGPLRLTLKNLTAARQQLILERLASYEDRTTASLVSVYQEFRDLFSSEVLSPGVQLGIRTLPMLFTDLKGSTSLYERLGDAGAYALVRDHFGLLQGLVARHGGGLVKTIGDAVMAAFPTGEAAVACALRIHADLDRFNRDNGQSLRLKVGLHQGPCIAVRAYDDRLDYFGSTVNLAARTHQESRGEDIVISEAMLADPRVARLVDGVRKEPFIADLRGIGKVPLVRLHPGR